MITTESDLKNEDSNEMAMTMDGHQCLETSPVLRAASVSFVEKGSMMEVQSSIPDSPTSPTTFNLFPATRRRSSSLSSLPEHGDGNHNHHFRLNGLHTSTLKRKEDRRPLSPASVHSLVEEYTVTPELSQLICQSFPGSFASRQNDLLIGIVVSRWDNIVGPQCVYLWTEERTSSYYPGNLGEGQLTRVVKYVTDHTVDHQDVDRPFLSSSTQRTTFCLVPDLNLAYISISVRVPTDFDWADIGPASGGSNPDRPAPSVPHAIAVLAHLNFLSQFLLMRPLLSSWLTEFAPKITVLLAKNKLHSSMINSWCAELCKTMSVVRKCWTQNRKIQQHSYQSHQNTDSSLIFCDFGSILDIDTECIPPRSLPKGMLGPVLTSCLSTFSTSIVVGNDNVAVNQVIRFLMCFLSVPEKFCSKYLSSLRDTFMKGLYIQGLMMGEIGDRSLSFNQVTSSRYPSTRIEVCTKGKVRQMLSQVHRQQRDSIQMQELTSLWSSTPFVSPPLDPFPHVSKEVAGFVQRLIDDLNILPFDRRYARILIFRKMIHARAIALINYLNSIKSKPRKDKAKMVKVASEILGLDDYEYLIVQVAADKIRPGVMQLILS